MMRYITIIIGLFHFLAGAQNTRKVDFTEGDIQMEITPEKGLIAGKVVYRFKVNEQTDTILVSSRGLQIKEVILKDEPLNYEVEGNNLMIMHPFEEGLYEDLVIQYQGSPEKAVYFPGFTTSSFSEDPTVVPGEGGKQVWTQGQGKYTSSWVPSFDDMNEKVVYTMEILFPRGYEVLASGQFKGKEELKDKTLWKYALKKPVSSYLLAFVAGKYSKMEERSKSGVPLEMYYYPSDSARVQTTYAYSGEIFDFLENEIGVPYPWKVYRQVPVRDFLYAGMENVTLTVFSDSFTTDSIAFYDKNYVNVNAHELAHHWFGNLVTEESGKHHWLQEGFATYYALLAERELFGEDHYYWKLYNSAVQLIRLSEDGKGEALLDPHAGSLTFYEKGAWALHSLKEKVGVKAFRSGVKEMLITYGFKNINTGIFLEMLSKYTNVDLEEFRSQWLEAAEFPEEEVVSSLKKNRFIREYIEIHDDDASPVVVYNEYRNILKEPKYYPLKQMLLKRASAWPEKLRDSFWLEALRSDDLYVRQGVAMAADTIPAALKKSFENLLDDRSYVTIQEALMKLWLAFPDERYRYLERTKDLKGFEDRSLRILWLGLALFTPEYEEDSLRFFEELQSYTGPGWQFETRQHAFEMLFEIGGVTKRSLLNLVQGLDHPAWQFSRFCRTMFDRLILKPEVRIQLRTIMPELDPVLADRLRSKLDSIKLESH